MTPHQVAQFAEAHYSIQATATEMPGDADLNFCLTSTEGKRYVFKLADTRRTAASIEFQIAFLLHLSTTQLPVTTPMPVESRDGDHVIRIQLNGQSRLAHLLTWVDGRPLRELGHRNDALLRQWGEVCGQLSQALASFDHPAAHHKYRWDPQHAKGAARLLHLISNRDDRDLAKRSLSRYTALTSSRLRSLRRGVNYNDAHEDNLLVDLSNFSPAIIGLIDVGDAVYSPVVCELAIACAYAAMDCPDPLQRMRLVTAGYHAQYPLEANEVDALFGLILGRLVLTVTAAAEAQRKTPDNVYKSISEASAWSLLRKLDGVHPVFARAHLRAACGWEPYPERAVCLEAIKRPAIPIIDLANQHPAPLDLTVGSRELGHYSEYEELPRFERRISEMLQDANTRVGYGGYLETRPFYTTDLFRHEGNYGPRWRTVHLGLDLWCAANTPVRAPLDATVHSACINDGPRDYGGTVILRHQLPDNEHFYTLYGHLAHAEVLCLNSGQTVAAGEAFAKTGEPAENGGWPPHLHFQVLTHLLGNEQDFPGVAFPEEASIYASFCPDPAVLAGLSASKTSAASGDLISRRRTSLGASYSLSYDKPLHIVRGRGTHLLAANGRRYLDMVNNVAHVGHEHPAVVEAIHRQAAVLNTNTRYLHEEAVAFAEELKATLPAALSVVHVVNSGSEANELALRMARAATGRQDVIALEAGYHGNTGATIAVSAYKFDGHGGEGAPSTTHIVPMPDVYRGKHREPATAVADYTEYIDQIITRISHGNRAPAAFISESILSCGGQVVLPKGYLKAAYAKTRAAGGVCIADEVQTGVGRVGSHFWAFELQGVVPDIVVIGKPIGNGHPLGVVVCTRAVAEAFAATGMEYFNTFGGNPVSCAAGRAVLRVVEKEGLQENARKRGGQLLQGLRDMQTKHPSIGDVRGAGLFVGFELVRDAEARTPYAEGAHYLANRVRERGVLLSTDGPQHNVIKLKPPMCIKESEVQFALEQIERVLAELT